MKATRLAVTRHYVPAAWTSTPTVPPTRHGKTNSTGPAAINKPASVDITRPNREVHPRPCNRSPGAATVSGVDDTRVSESAFVA